MFGNQQNQPRYGFYKENSDNDPNQDPSQSMQGPVDHDSDNDINKTNLIVNYLPQYMTDKDLYTMFVTQGAIENVRIMKDYKTGYSYGFGFVKFVCADDAARAITALNGVEYYNKRLKVSYARPPGQDIKDSNLYVTNLPKNVTEDDVEKIFCEYGTIVQKNLLKDKITGMPRGVAFVRFARRDDAQNAIQQLNGKFLEGCMEPLVVKIAEEHGKQKATYYEGWKAGYNMTKGFRNVMRGTNNNFARRGGGHHAHMGGGGGGPMQMNGRGGGGYPGGVMNGRGGGHHRFNPMMASMGAGGDMGGYQMMNSF